jgi:hypothetical protein
LGIFLAKQKTRLSGAYPEKKNLNLYDINWPIKSNHNLTNQNSNKMVGRPAAAAGGGGLILGDGQAQGAM